LIGGNRTLGIWLEYNEDTYTSEEDKGVFGDAVLIRGEASLTAQVRGGDGDPTGTVLQPLNPLKSSHVKVTEAAEESERSLQILSHLVREGYLYLYMHYGIITATVA
jgi:hypothetical protein